MTATPASPQVTASATVTAEPVLPPERQNENFGNNPGLRRGRLPCNSLPHQSLPPGQTRCGDDPVVARLPRGWFCRRSGKTKILATTPAFAGAGSHATVSRTKACHRARPGGATSRWWRGYRGAGFAAGAAKRNFRQRPHATVSHTRACHRARPGGAATRWWRHYRAAGFAAGAAKRKSRPRPHATVNRTKACHRARPGAVATRFYRRSGKPKIFGHDPMQQSAAPTPATGPDPVRRRPGFTAGAANRNFRPRPHATVSHTGACHRARPGGAATRFCRRSRKTKISATTPCNSQPHQSLPPGQTRCGGDPVLPPERQTENFRPRPRPSPGQAPMQQSATPEPATGPDPVRRRPGVTAGAAKRNFQPRPHATVSHTGACHRARPGAVATRFYRRSGKAKFSATTPAFAGAGSHATVSHTGACHRARPGAAATRCYRRSGKPKFSATTPCNSQPHRSLPPGQTRCGGDPVLPPERQNEIFSNGPMQQSATPEPATGPDPVGRRPGFAAAGAAKRNFRQRPRPSPGQAPMQQSTTPEPATGPDPGGDNPAVGR